MFFPLLMCSISKQKCSRNGFWGGQNYGRVSMCSLCWHTSKLGDFWIRSVWYEGETGWIWGQSAVSEREWYQKQSQMYSKKWCKTQPGIKNCIIISTCTKVDFVIISPSIFVPTSFSPSSYCLIGNILIWIEWLNPSHASLRESSSRKLFLWFTFFRQIKIDNTPRKKVCFAFGSLLVVGVCVVWRANKSSLCVCNNDKRTLNNHFVFLVLS